MPGITEAIRKLTLDRVRNCIELLRDPQLELDPEFGAQLLNDVYFIRTEIQRAMGRGVARAEKASMWFGEV